MLDIRFTTVYIKNMPTLSTEIYTEAYIYLCEGDCEHPPLRSREAEDRLEFLSDDELAQVLGYDSFKEWKKDYEK
jgi:hypothetical protein